MATNRNITPLFEELNREIALAGDDNACAVVAISVITGKPYREVAEWLEKQGRLKKKPTRQFLIEKALTDMGYRLVAVDPLDIIRMYPGRHASTKRWITTHHPARFHARWPAGVFLMFTKGHVLTVVDGVVHDWSSQNSLRVTSIYRVEHA